MDRDLRRTPVKPAARAADLETVRRWARLLDSQFRIPGTNVRFGLDPIIGFLPGLGDFIGPAFALVVIVHAWKMRVPKVVIARMLVNAGVDAVLGLVPLLGDAADVFWKANQTNVRLLEQHAFEGRTTTSADWVVVILAAVAAFALAALPILAVIWIGRQLF